MADFTQITGRFFTGGGINTPADVQAILLAGITHVIDCRAEQDDSPLFAGTGITYLWNGVADDGLSKGDEWFARSLSFALPTLMVPNRKVLSHCAAGRNRGPSTCYALMRAVGFDPSEALGMIHIKRPITLGGIAYSGDADRAIKALGYD